MNEEKQKLLLEYLISSPDTFAICQKVVKPEYFDPEFRNTVRFIKEYYKQYSTTPSPLQIKAEAGQNLEQYVIHADEMKYCCREIGKFCKRKALENAALGSAQWIADGNYTAFENAVREAIQMSLETNLGLNYFEDPERRLKSMLQDDPTESTGWLTLDELLFGGISRGELLLVSANSGGGKSITLGNLGLNFAERGRRVLYISLELSEKIIAQRFDTMLTGIGRKDWKNHVSEIATKIESYIGKSCGGMDIVQMSSGTNANTIRGYLKEYYLFYKCMPDLLILDYIDNMSPNDDRVSADNIWQRDKACSEELRQIGVDFNMFVATASQLNREAVKATQHDHSHIAGGISKINVSDVYISIKMTEAMRAQGQLLFDLQKTRNSDGVGKKIYMKWDSKYLRIKDDVKPFDLKLIKKDKAKSVLDDTPTGEGLDGLLARNDD